QILRLRMNPSERHMSPRTLLHFLTAQDMARRPGQTIIGVYSTFPQNSTNPAQEAKALTAINEDLQQHRGRSVIIPGDHASPAVHALAHAMNAALGNVGKTIFYSDPIEPNPAIQINDLKALVDELKANKVDLLVLLGVHPC